MTRVGYSRVRNVRARISGKHALYRTVIKPIVDVAWMTAEKGLDQGNDLGSLFDRRRWDIDLLRGNCNGYPLPPSPVRINIMSMRKDTDTFARPLLESDPMRQLSEVSVRGKLR
jgi:hypothetical protein